LGGKDGGKEKMGHADRKCGVGGGIKGEDVVCIKRGLSAMYEEGIFVRDIIQNLAFLNVK
jgi:hypothetical protein